MLVKNKKNALYVLVLFSLLSGILWRAELEYHGWDGLNWLSYVHSAIPVSLGLFVLWVNVLFKLKPIGKRLVANLLLLFWMILGTYSIWLTLVFVFQGGPIAMLYHSLPGIYWGVLLCTVSLFLPLIALLSLRLIRIKIPKEYVLVSLILFWSAIPMAIFLIDITPQKGIADMVHAFKTGFVFPFLFFSLGFPLIYSASIVPKKEREGDPSVLDALD